MIRRGENTKFTIDRKLFSSDIWLASPWKLKIWIYLIGNANHTDGKFMDVDIKRGQLLRSYNTIAEDCAYYIGYRKKKPSISTVRRICEDFAKELRITLRKKQHGTLITLLKYNDLQKMGKQRKNNGTDCEGNNDEQVGETNKNNKEEINLLFEKFWSAYGKKVGKKKTLTRWNNLSNKNRQLAFNGVAEYVKRTPNAQYRKNPEGYLNNRTWEDESTESFNPMEVSL